MFRTTRSSALVATLLIAAHGCSDGAPVTGYTTPTLLHGPFVGDVGPDRAIVWARAGGCTDVVCELRRAGRTDGAPLSRTAKADDVGALHFVFDGLQPGTEYELSLPALGEKAHRTFHTAPAPDQPAAVRIAFGGDIGGQHYGRDVDQDIPALTALHAEHADVFVGLGDMVYATRDIPKQSRVGNAQVPLGFRIPSQASYHEHWKYLHDSPAWQAALSDVSYMGIWDDHEVNNNFGPNDSFTYFETGRTAMFAWNPLAGAPDEARRQYRSVRWGRHCEMWVLDCRAYRALTWQNDDGPLPKSMLGRRQVQWLLRGLAASDATWKVIVSSVPLTAPTGDVIKGRDGWADDGSETGYERELVELMRKTQQLGIAQPIWVAADAHHAEVIRLHPFDDAPDFAPIEIVTGPLNAGNFGRGDLDPTLKPESLFYLDPNAPTPHTYAEILRVWNFLMMDIDVAGDLRLRVIDATGAERYRLDLAARSH
ncbi:MAG: alkaline phosphatase D family protein [Planctomycetes bacterium]|nr:alkaline phosphatase D family protein [Planctomycetota bacterium]